MYAVHVRFRPEAAVDGVYEIRFLGGETISMHVEGGELVARKLAAENPTLVVEAPPEALHAVVQGVVPPHAAIADGRLRILVGTERELANLIGMFAPDEAGVATAAA
jgi:putative sterol carrier protein